MIDRLISLQAAIAAADYADYPGLAIEDVKKVTDEVVKRLKQLPSAQTEHNPDDERKIADLHKMVNYLLSQQEQRWIPVSERPPENDDWQIVSILDESGDTPYRYSDFGWYLDKAECWIIDAEQRTDIIAWMPLPEPYKKGGEAE